MTISHTQRLGMLLALPLLLLFWAATIHAHDDTRTDNCPDATSRFEVEVCLRQGLLKSDRDLNRLYKQAMDAATRFDEEFELPRKTADLLRDAQRRWIPYRDAACAAEINPSVLGGGSYLRADLGCQLRLTRRRVLDLSSFAETLR